MIRHSFYLGHKVRKRFGQNFLKDPAIISSIVSEINPKPGQSLVEVGPGLGALTEPFFTMVDNLSAIELDKNLAERLRSRPEFKDRLTVYECDAQLFDFSCLVKEEKKILLQLNAHKDVESDFIVRLYETFTDATYVCFVFEYLPG